ncbi:Pimeloyl-ACP methyl ester carboxylesterase [Sulfitobacter brevis]|uniref:Pimeloyl-ACP methyl ester carboxylesterase n=1 Tax=Sulfitobacter brevis TaxID=74348 RepID=A0A1I1T2L1_9RHOB|nr:alpha/beta hydrolase [Sulfitobacter brevis]SFD52872.1 Pimeloyl-ACP methyl ester carboxylesterase [Sulfitobacter brevis]
MRPQQGFTPHISTMGQGPRRAMALHCNLAHGGAWGGVARALDDQLTLIAPDMPSNGRSPDWDEVSDFSDTVYCTALETMDDAPMDVMGHSFGAAVAVRLAVEHPDRVRSLTLFEPVLFSIAQADAPESMVEHEAQAADFYDAYESGDREEAARRFNRMWSDGPAWANLPERSRAAMIRAIPVVPATQDFLFRDSAGLLAEGVLEGCAIPALVMRGEDTLSVVKETNKGLARRLPNAAEVVIEGAGHMGPITHPQEVAEAIAGLLARS